jgi:enterobacteria phage integrase
VGRRRKRPGPHVPNLYERRGYFCWRDPRTGDEHGLGRDRREAIAQAVEANVHLAGLNAKPRLIDRLTGSPERTIGAWLEKYAAICRERGLAKNTLASYKSMGVRLLHEFAPALPIRAVTVMMVGEIIERIAAEGTRRMAQAFRSFLIEYFKAAIQAGWVDVGKNPAEPTRAPSNEVKRARLTLDVFMAAYRSEIEPWLRNAMALALVSGQRREDIAAARCADVRDGCWFVQQGKTSNRVSIPLELRLESFGMSLAEVYEQCRGLSPFLIHHTQPKGRAKFGAAVDIGLITRRFTAAVASLGIDWGGKSPPTFHEIRSLAKREYDRQGGVNTKQLLAHKSDANAEKYADPRGAEWVRVSLG